MNEGIVFNCLKLKSQKQRNEIDEQKRSRNDFGIKKKKKMRKGLKCRTGNLGFKLEFLQKLLERNFPKKYFVEKV
jgi:hypothetical protein